MDAPEAFEVIYVRHSRVAFSLAFRLVGDRQSAEDLVQHAFLSVWRGASTHAAGRGSVRNWLLSILHNRGIDRLRTLAAQSRRQEALERVELRRPDESDAAEPGIGRAMAGAVRDELTALPAEQYDVLRLAYYGGFTTARSPSCSSWRSAPSRAACAWVSSGRAAARVEAHAAGCACAARSRPRRAGADVLAPAVEPVDPPESLKRSLMDTVRAVARAPSPLPRHRRRGERRRPAARLEHRAADDPGWPRRRLDPLGGRHGRRPGDLRAGGLPAGRGHGRRAARPVPAAEGRRRIPALGDPQRAAPPARPSRSPIAPCRRGRSWCGRRSPEPGQ